MYICKLANFAKLSWKQCQTFGICGETLTVSMKYRNEQKFPSCPKILRGVRKFDGHDPLGSKTCPRSETRKVWPHKTGRNPKNCYLRACVPIPKVGFPLHRIQSQEHTFKKKCFTTQNCCSHSLSSKMRRNMFFNVYRSCLMVRSQKFRFLDSF